MCEYIYFYIPSQNHMALHRFIYNAERKFKNAPWINQCIFGGAYFVGRKQTYSDLFVHLCRDVGKENYLQQ